MTTRVGVLEGVEVRGAAITGLVNVLTPEALGFVARLHREFNPTRESLLKRRAQRQAQLDSGVLPDFLPETEFVRRGEWWVAPAPADLENRRVEITGPGCARACRP